ARGALLPSNSDESGEEVGESSGKENGAVEPAPAAVLPLQSDEQVVVEEEPRQAEGEVEVEEARGEQQERSDE
ncbi:MAG: hypothetical protein PVF77_16370, partial [Anaerolineae bacterium]